MPSFIRLLLSALALRGVTLGEVCKCVSLGVLNPTCNMTTAVALRQDCVLTWTSDSFRDLLAFSITMGFIQRYHFWSTYPYRSARIRLLPIRAQLQRGVLQQRTLQLDDLEVSLNRLCKHRVSQGLSTDIPECNEHQW